MRVTIILFNRLGIDLDKVTDVQSILAVVACSAALLNAPSETKVEARARDPMGLVGDGLRKPLVQASRADKSGLAWWSQIILDNTPATSLLLIEAHGTVACRASVVGSSDVVDGSSSSSRSVPRCTATMLILNKVLGAGGSGGHEEVYLPDVQILPSKKEISFLPLNCQSVLVLPWGDGGAAVLGTNRAKSIRLGDMAKIRASLSISDGL